MPQNKFENNSNMYGFSCKKSKKQPQQQQQQQIILSKQVIKYFQYTVTVALNHEEIEK